MARRLAGIRAVQADEDVSGVAGRARPEREAPVVLLVDQLVVRRVGAQAVAPQLVGPLRLVHADVEDEVGAGGPGEPVAGVRNRLGRRVRGGLGIDRPEAQLVLLVARAVGGPGEPAVVVAHRGAAHGEVLGPLGLHVLVEQDLLFVAGLARGRQLVAPPGRAPAMDGVALPLFGARVVPPGAPARRHRHVGFLDAGLHLVEEALAEGGERRRLAVGVGILGFEVRQDLGVVPVTQPEPGVLALVAVGGDHVGAL